MYFNLIEIILAVLPMYDDLSHKIFKVIMERYLHVNVSLRLEYLKNNLELSIHITAGYCWCKMAV